MKKHLQHILYFEINQQKKELIFIVALFLINQLQMLHGFLYQIYVSQKQLIKKFQINLQKN